MVIFTTYSGVERFKRSLNALCLLSIGVVEHYADGSVTSRLDGLHSRMFFSDVVAVRGGVTPLDLNGVAVFNEAVDFEGLRALPKCVGYANRTGIRILFQEAESCGFLQE